MKYVYDYVENKMVRYNIDDVMKIENPTLEIIEKKWKEYNRYYTSDHYLINLRWSPISQIMAKLLWN